MGNKLVDITAKVNRAAIWVRNPQASSGQRGEGICAAAAAVLLLLPSPAGDFAALAMGLVGTLFAVVGNQNPPSDMTPVNVPSLDDIANVMADTLKSYFDDQLTSDDIANARDYMDVFLNTLKVASAPDAKFMADQLATMRDFVRFDDNGLPKVMIKIQNLVSPSARPNDYNEEWANKTCSISSRKADVLNIIRSRQKQRHIIQAMSRGLNELSNAIGFVKGYMDHYNFSLDHDLNKTFQESILSACNVGPFLSQVKRWETLRDAGKYDDKCIPSTGTSFCAEIVQGSEYMVWYNYGQYNRGSLQPNDCNTQGYPSEEHGTCYNVRTHTLAELSEPFYDRFKCQTGDFGTWQCCEAIMSAPTWRFSSSLPVLDCGDGKFVIEGGPAWWKKGTDDQQAIGGAYLCRRDQNSVVELRSKWLLSCDCAWYIEYGCDNNETDCDPQSWYISAPPWWDRSNARYIHATRDSLNNKIVGTQKTKSRWKINVTKDSSEYCYT
eukprot:TRINITY_DN11638_c0_g2_i1.p1 TRINITY_DN11638_c0_g2~~TRINITY_DN11638_c0_g2_i1.p1  ORF type:complete len:577 (-),score=73.76 TRINITY_DN11638_c0_g2_i1:157-1641(-)